MRHSWIYNQGQLGNALQELGAMNSDCQALLGPVKALNLALESYKNGEDQSDDYICHIRLHKHGHCVLLLYQRCSDSNPYELGDAVNSFIGAIDLISMEKHPREYGNTYDCLGDALYLAGMLNGKAESFQSAIHAYQQSQRINTIQDQPEKFAELNEKIETVNLE